MTLASQQRTLLGLLRATYAVRAEDDAYIHEVARSCDLKEAQRNIFLWRIYVLERTCALTFALLKEKGLLQDAVNVFIGRQNISPFRETQGPAFLEMLRDHADVLVASVAGFELALMRVKGGDPAPYTIPWSVEPHGILKSLATHTPLPEHVRAGRYDILVSRDLACHFDIREAGGAPFE